MVSIFIFIIATNMDRYIAIIIDDGGVKSQELLYNYVEPPMIF